MCATDYSTMISGSWGSQTRQLGLPWGEEVYSLANGVATFMTTYVHFVASAVSPARLAAVLARSEAN